jgi:hypothetical protein
MSKPIEKLVLNMEQKAAIEEQAHKEGFVDMKTWGEKFIAAHETTRLEVERVIG